MSFTLRLVKGSALTWAEFDNNLSEIEAKWLEALDASALAQAAANFQGNWTALTGPLAVPASVRHNGEYWMLLNDLANVATSQPGVSADWSVIGNLRKSGDTMTGPLAQAAGTAALPSYTFSGDTNTGIYSPGADRVGIATAGAQRVEVDASGNVGVGTSSPGAKLHVQAGSLTAPAWSASDVVIASNSAGTTSFFQAHSDVGGGLVFSTPTVRARSFVLWSEASGLMTLQNGLPTGGAIRFMNNGAERLTIDTNSNVLVTGSGGLGYGVGSGGTVTQATSKSTGVTLNKPAGRITMNGAALSAGASVSFVLNSTLISAGDVVTVNVASATVSYKIEINYVVAGGVSIKLTNTTGVSLSEAVLINFAVIKGATS